MSILILMPLAENRGGAEQLLHLLLQRLSTTSLNVSLVFLESGPLHEECKELNIPSTVVPVGRLRNLGGAVRAVRRIVEITNQTQADLIFSWMAKAHFYGSLASQATGVPCAWYQHGLPRNTTWLNRFISFFPAAAVLACSQTVARAQRRSWPHHPTWVVPPCANLNRFDPAALPSKKEARRTLELPGEGPLIGMVGRLQRWKGMHTLVDAMPQILADYPEAHAVIVGGCHEHEPEYEALLDQEIRVRNLQDRVLRAGFQSNVPLWMQAMDVFVHASDNEPFGIVIIEAMSLGKPVVAGDRGGPTEIITEEENGLLAPYEDADALSRQILRYLDNPRFAHQMGKGARKRARDFGPEAYAREFVDTIVEIVRDHTITSAEHRHPPHLKMD